MRKLTGGLAALLLASSLLATSTGLAQSAPSVLSSKDAATYEAAFQAVKRGEFDGLDALVRRVHDKCLLGRLTYLKLMHADYHASFQELKSWLSRYPDQPDAANIYALARKRRPEASGGLDALDRPGPRSGSASAGPGELAKPKPTLDAKVLAAREAYYQTGDLQLAFTLANRSGERWIAGLAAFRLGRYGTAAEKFSALAGDGTQSVWVRSGAAFWAARALIADGAPEKSLSYLQLAARAPYTFYGMIAERQLGLDPAVDRGGLDMGGEGGELPASASPGDAKLAAKALARFIKTDKRAKRAAALSQIGQSADAYEELRTALFASGTDALRSKWRALAKDLGASLAASAAPVKRVAFDLSAFPNPDLAPLGGYTLDRALIFAIVRQESGFDPTATSAAGALGLMQVTPATAAINAGVAPGMIDASLLLDPATNLRLGQDYVARLLSQSEGDLLRAVAAYNAGPRGVNRLAATMPQADSLLLIESLPAAETREYVQRVISNYWIYRRLFTQPTPTLDAAASGAKTILAALDDALGLQSKAMTEAAEGQTDAVGAPGGAAASFSPAFDAPSR